MSFKKIINAALLLALVISAVFSPAAYPNPKPQTSVNEKEKSTSFEKIDSSNTETFGDRLLICDSISLNKDSINTDTLPSKFSNFVASSSAKSAVKAASAETSASGKKSAPSGVYFPLTPAQRDKIERILMSSCGAYGSLMAKANAQVILDRVQSGRFGKTLDEVLDAPHQFEKPYKGRVNSKVKEAVKTVFDRGERVVKTRIFYYINPYLSEVSPEVWRKGKRYVTTIGKGKCIHEYWTDKDI